MARVAGGKLAAAKAAFLILALLPPLLVTAVFWFLPIGDLGADRVAMAARDYSDMWAAGHLVAVGKLQSLFDIDVFNAALRTMFGRGYTYQMWPYPPPMLLLAVPLSMLPLLAGFLLYTAGTVGILWWALRSGGLSKTTCVAVVLSSAVAANALAGQNGSLIGAILFGGLALAHRRPALAGAMLGALLIKPQFGLLIPLCLVAAGNWRALLAMAISAVLLTAASGALFGIDAWVGFFVRARPMIDAVLDAPWQATPSQRIFASVLMAARSVGASLNVAYGLQAAATIICAAVAWRTWRRQNVDPLLRATFTGLLVIAAAPWVHTYDMIPLAIAVTLLVPTARPTSLVLLGYAWVWPGVVDAFPVPLSLSVASVVYVAFLVWCEIWRAAPAERTAADVAKPHPPPRGTALCKPALTPAPTPNEDARYPFPGRSIPVGTRNSIGVMKRPCKNLLL